MRGLAVRIGVVALCGAALGQEMPQAIRGEWRIVRILPTKNAACWDEARARELVGTRLRYEEGSMTWKGGSVEVSDTYSRTLTSQNFRGEYKVGLEELGIRAGAVTEFDLQHEDADVTGSTTEVPGDTVVLAGPGRIVVSACGVYYSAVRVTPGRGER